MPCAYYNEHDAYAAQWLRNLIAAGHIAPGDVDERSIVDVRPDDLRGYEQCHFFAGIGGWSIALRRAGWPDDRPVWTGSCPCQPFSVAGKGSGTEDERHLWPAFFELIRERRPLVVFGEQVASKGALHWLDAVCADLEGAGYAVGAVDTCAAGFGAPHIRQRMYWVAESGSERREGLGVHVQPRQSRPAGVEVAGRCAAGGVADASRARLEVGVRDGRVQREAAGAPERQTSFGNRAPDESFWAECDWLECRDGKARPVEPGTFPLAHGAPGRVGRLRAYGNCIVIDQAAEFVAAYRGLKCC